jgi:formylglycine-generating enzyme required for sulfatase activity
MPGKIFINYRRADDPGFTTALYQRLEAEFGAEDLFMDVEGHIKPGDDFAVVINAQVAAAEAMLVVIGPRWAALLEARAGDVNDYVVVEIKAALKQGKRLIPVLVGGANPPRAEQLPKSIRPLARRHAVGLRPDRFKADCQALVTALRAQLLAAETERPARSDTGIAAAAQAAAPAAAEQGDQAEGRIKVDARVIHGAPGGLFKPGAGKVEWFKDIDIGPEMVVVPAERPFAIGRFALTFDEWDAAQAHPEWRMCAGIAPRTANDHSWGRGRQPAIDVSWDDAKAYCLWLSKVTSKSYRLPSEAEWELCSRAGTTTGFWWGDEITTDQANYNGNHPLDGGQKGEYRERTVAVDSFVPNPWGLYQVHGNVWEWCEDQYDASSRVLRGGSWNGYADYLRSAGRDVSPPGARYISVGFRVARTLQTPIYLNI